MTALFVAALVILIVCDVATWRWSCTWTGHSSGTGTSRRAWRRAESDPLTRRAESPALGEDCIIPRA